MTHDHAGPGPAVLGFLDGRPLPRAELDRRLAEMRAGRRSSALPLAGSAEDRQLTRWAAQVLLTERLCEAEAAERGLGHSADPPVRLDQRAAVELGSITAAAFEGSSAVRAVYRAVTAGVTAAPEAVAAYAPGPASAPADRPWRLSTPDGDFDAHPDSLPRDLAAALRAAPAGRQVTVRGWTARLVAATVPEPAAEPASERLTEAARRAVFVRWLDAARGRRLELVPGLEHPGDPAQPDNHHRH
ncbi:hypothetical protein OG689_01480 [Kitasatospora sp. NBC_00240]|uniref:DUF7158 domain-containing protein n=1 Tax=Kitasatospora sp. NBC_00240 TaxID=2903567 RepID=UPI00224DE4B8|nr:hypothetical protein [Kitasatospora sp. NBC_00240]MCX5207997.1 hypothetical protein [Kitasatospora sp. NBC_00240]